MIIEEGNGLQVIGLDLRFIILEAGSLEDMELGSRAQNTSVPLSYLTGLRGRVDEGGWRLDEDGWRLDEDGWRLENFLRTPFWLLALLEPPSRINHNMQSEDIVKISAPMLGRMPGGIVAY